MDNWIIREIKMRKNSLKIASVILAASLVAGCGNADLTKTADVSSSLEEIVTVASVTKASSSNPNDTVYVVTNADGEVEKVFDANDSSIPVDIKITYTLDGQEMSPKSLAGKSGHVTIRFDYTNNKYEEVMVGGEAKNVYVPFTMVSGLLLDDAHFTNIEITNGKLIDDGNRTIALGLSFPGLKENFSLEDYDIDVTIPEYVEVSADVTDFKLDMTLSIATNEVFSEIDTEDIHTIDDLKESLDKLNDAMEEILDGSAKLYDGLDTLYGKVNELSDGVSKLHDGANALADGAREVANGASQVSNGASQVAGGASELSGGADALSNGAYELAQGLATLSANNDTLNGAARTVFETLLATASNSLKDAGFDVNLTIDNYGEVLMGVANTLEPDSAYLMAQNMVTAKVEENTAAIESGVTSAVKDQVTSNVTSQVRDGARETVTGMVREAAKAQITAQVREGARETAYTQVSEGVKTTIEAEHGSEIMQAVKAAVYASQGIDDATYEVLDDATKEVIDAAVNENYNSTVDAKVNEYMASNDGVNTVNGYVDEYMASDDAANTIDGYLNAYMASDAAASQIEGGLDTYIASEDGQAMVNGYVDSYMSSEEAANIIASNVTIKKQELIAENMSGAEVQSQLEKASAGLQTIANLKASLDSYNQFYVGLNTYTAGVAAAANGANTLYNGSVTLKNGAGTLAGGASTLANGASTLANGASTLANGAVELRDGVTTLYNSMPQLIDGVDQLKNGANDLHEGLSLFNEEGIQKLNSVVTDDVETLIDRFKATVDVSKNYRSTSGSDENSSIKFIFRSEAID